MENFRYSKNKHEYVKIKSYQSLNSLFRRCFQIKGYMEVFISISRQGTSIVPKVTFINFWRRSAIDNRRGWIKAPRWVEMLNYKGREGSEWKQYLGRCWNLTNTIFKQVFLPCFLQSLPVTSASLFSSSYQFTNIWVLMIYSQYI